MTPVPPVEVIALLPEERARLLELLSGLTDEQWRAPTVCPGWSVKDLAQHLLGDDIGVLSRQRDGQPGFAIATQGGGPPSWEEIVAAVNANNALWVEATRRISPRLLIELLRATGEALAAFYATLVLDALGGAVAWAGPDPAPVWLDVAREYTERWVHQQQMRDALGQPGLMEPRLFAPVLAAFVRALPRALAGAEAPLGTCVQLTITGEAGGTWYAVNTASGWALSATAPTAPRATAMLDQETAWRLFTKGLAREDAAARATFGGDLALARRVLDMVAILA